MEKILGALILLFLCAVQVWAQDIIVKHNGEKLKVKVNYLTESGVAYSEPGVEGIRTVGKPEVERIIYQAGMVEMVSAKVDVRGEGDWEKVVVTFNPLDVTGLKKRGEVASSLGSNSDFHGRKGGSRKEMDRVKRNAASLGGHIVYIKRVDAVNWDKEATGDIREMAVIYGY
ncbi:hypothetical protein DYBT9275_03244 [Dyadobacter sp. CECT 9275]|uniref:Uncharacterized protein n=1 Tax=Dyadobacter helix TaxID=2822344 RepID=A0A916JCA6_9BACT|nr:hypothetical protein [Dyadobacter sp. CECT 9275]CAG5003859.1 hypothetical protein DYBT9275_03244 [Dyadobacter sp. CECT 9275]